MDVVAQNPATEVSISDNKVDIKVNWPIKANKNDLTNSINELIVSHNIKLGKIHKNIKKIIDEELANPGFIPSSLLLESEFKIDTVNFQQNIVYVIQDNDYIFLFADKDTREVEI